MRDHLSRATAFAGQKGWSLRAGSTVHILNSTVRENNQFWQIIRFDVRLNKCDRTNSGESAVCWNVFRSPTKRLV